MHGVQGRFLVAVALPLLLLLTGPGDRVLPAAHAKDAPRAEPTYWNGRDKARDVWASAKTYFDADASTRKEIEAALDALGEIRPGDVKKYAKKLLKYAASAGPKLGKKNGKTFTHGGLTGKLHIAGARKK